MSDKDTLRKFIGTLKACNKYDAQLNTGEVMNWIDEHIDRKRFTVATCEGEYPLKDEGGHKYLMVVSRHFGQERGKETSHYQMFCYMSPGNDDGELIRLSTSDADALGAGFDTWRVLQASSND